MESFCHRFYQFTHFTSTDSYWWELLAWGV